MFIIRYSFSERQIHIYIHIKLSKPPYNIIKLAEDSFQNTFFLNFFFSFFFCSSPQQHYYSKKMIPPYNNGCQIKKKLPLCATCWESGERERECCVCIYASDAIRLVFMCGGVKINVWGKQ